MPRAATSTLVLRQASLRDLAAVEDLLAKTNLPLGGVSESIDSFVVAENDGCVVGTAGVERHGPYGLLRSVGVDPSSQRQGVGRALIERLISDSERSGIAELYLLTTTAEKYFPAFGFTKIDRGAAPAEIQSTSEFKDLCPSSATVMRRSLKE